nr:hypothetical protein [Tanacetum cinerariifolium]
TLRKQAWAMVGVLLLELNQDIWVFRWKVRILSRPIRWILALHCDGVVPFVVTGI